MISNPNEEVSQDMPSIVGMSLDDYVSSKRPQGRRNSKGRGRGRGKGRPGRGQSGRGRGRGGARNRGQKRRNPSVSVFPPAVTRKRQIRTRTFKMEQEEQDFAMEQPRTRQFSNRNKNINTTGQFRYIDPNEPKRKNHIVTSAAQIVRTRRSQPLSMRGSMRSSAYPETFSLEEDKICPDLDLEIGKLSQWNHEKFFGFIRSMNPRKYPEGIFCHGSEFIFAPDFEGLETEMNNMWVVFQLVKEEKKGKLRCRAKNVMIMHSCQQVGPKIGNGKSGNGYCVSGVFDPFFAKNIIGKKGSVVKSIKKQSKVARIDIESKTGTDFAQIQVWGQFSNIIDCYMKVANIFLESSEMMCHKLVFLIDADKCGMMIGKKGANLKYIQGKQKTDCKVTISKQPVELMGEAKNTIRLQGTGPSFKQVLQRLVQQIIYCETNIKIDIPEDEEMEEVEEEEEEEEEEDSFEMK